MSGYPYVLDRVAATARNCGRDPSEITLVAVTKGHSWTEIQPAYREGCRDFGENRIPEAREKIAQAPTDVYWHFIGALQKNKVRKAIESFVLIHSVDTFELAKKISDCSIEMNRIARILLQVNTSGELTKQGLSKENWRRNIGKTLELPALSVEGLMTMAPFVEDERVIRNSFIQLRLLRDEFNLRHLSMGMSHDYPIAIEEGATILRIGTAIFGNCSYS